MDRSSEGSRAESTSVNCRTRSVEGIDARARAELTCSASELKRDADARDAGRLYGGNLAEGRTRHVAGVPRRVRVQHVQQVEIDGGLAFGREFEFLPDF